MSRSAFWDCMAALAVFLVSLGVLVQYGPDFSAEYAAKQAYKWCETVRGAKPENEWTLGFYDEAIPGCDCGRTSYIVDHPIYCCCPDVKGEMP